MKGLFSFYETINKVVLLPVDRIDPNPQQPRKIFAPEAIEELAESIRANGLLQPIIVRKGREGRFELVAGQRRLLAFQKLGKSTISAIVETMDDRSSAVLAIVENLQRKDLDYFEEAEGIAALIETYGMNQQQAAEKLGKAQSTIANKLRLLRFPPEIRQWIRQAGLSERHSRTLLRITDPPLLARALEKVIEHQYTVEETERLVDQLLAEGKPKATRLLIIKDIRLFVNTVNKAIDTMKQAGVPVDASQQEDEDYLCYTIRIPKSAAYRNRGIHSA